MYPKATLVHNKLYVCYVCHLLLITILGLRAIVEHHLPQSPVMIEIIKVSDGYHICRDGRYCGCFLLALDANWYALALLKEGLVTSVILPSGLEIR